MSLMQSEAKISNNRPVCRVCNNNDIDKFKVLDVGVARIDGVAYFEMISKCKKCRRNLRYFVDLDLKNRLTFDMSKVTYEKVSSNEKAGNTKENDYE